MELIPHDDLKNSNHFNFAPMIDFLFLMLSFFATLAISRTVLFDSKISLVELTPNQQDVAFSSKDVQQIHIAITQDGHYKWLTEFEEYPMESTEAIGQELARQYQTGILAQDKDQTEVLLHIDQQAHWRPIAEAIFAIREHGFHAHPVYEQSH